MDIFFQAIILTVGVTYKYLLIRRNVWGWILSATTSIVTIFYLFVYYKLPIVISLELCAMLLSFYGLYKHKSKIETLTKIDYTIIILTIVAIVYFVLKQLEAKTTFYEIGASIVFLSGIVLMAQKNYQYQITAWIFYNTGSVLMGIVYLQKEKWLILALNVISIFIGIYAIKKIFRSEK